jgi:hypothetical protein
VGEICKPPTEGPIHITTAVMPGHSRSKNGVASLAYVPGIHVFASTEDVDGRDKPGHDTEKKPSSFTFI